MYESFDPPPTISAFFDILSRDVTLKTNGLTKIADTAFSVNAHHRISLESPISTLLEQVVEDYQPS